MFDIIEKFKQKLRGVKAKYEPVHREGLPGYNPYQQQKTDNGVSVIDNPTPQPNVSIAELPKKEISGPLPHNPPMNINPNIKERPMIPGERSYNVKTGEKKFLSNDGSVEIIEPAPFKGKVEIIDKAPEKQTAPKTKPATLTVYHPEAAQTDSSPKIGGFLTEMEFGDVAIGNRDEYWKAHDKYVGKEDKQDTFIIIPELEQIVTPYGNGVFRVRDTLNKRYDGKNRIDIFMPERGFKWEKLVRETPSASYAYLN